ncbi:MAG: fumarylacetoacetate hydrolase family protein [Pseudomonadota bacterium]
MRCVSFIHNGIGSYGLLQHGQVFEATAAFRAEWPDLKSVLVADKLNELPGHLALKALDAGGLEYEPVIPGPDKILCVGVNYRPHVEEMGREVPGHPVVFVRFASSMVGHRSLLRRPGVSTQYDYEGELAIVIGRRARYVKRENARDYVAGYSPFFDGSVRDWQRHTTQFTAGKNFPASGALGPALVTPDEVSDVAALTLSTRINGEVMQQGRLSELIFDVPSLIEYCSTFTILEPGDVIATGTPGGVGAARRPPRWLKAGDEVEVDLGPVGCLRNTVADEDREES